MLQPSRQVRWADGAQDRGCAAPSPDGFPVRLVLPLASPSAACVCAETWAAPRTLPAYFEAVGGWSRRLAPWGPRWRSLPMLLHSLVGSLRDRDFAARAAGIPRDGGKVAFHQKSTHPLREVIQQLFPSPRRPLLLQFFLPSIPPDELWLRLNILQNSSYRLCPFQIAVKYLSWDPLLTRVRRC